VLFNEKWGAYDQQRLTEWVKRIDPSRIVNGHSGEILYVNEQLRSPSPNAWVSSDIADVHSYPDPMNAPAKAGRAQILGEFGGIGVFIPDHQWDANAAWGYVQVTPGALVGKYRILNQQLQLLELEGLSGSIYTQPFDVESEQNGLMTYDREIIKIPFETLRKIHAPLNPHIGILPEITAKNADITDPGMRYSDMLQQYLEGKKEPGFLKTLAMTATQVGDKNDARRIGAEYIATLKSPLSEADISSVSQFALSTKDQAFALMTANAEAFKQQMGERPYTVKLMNMIYKGDIEPLVEGNTNPDWSTISQSVKRYGAPGEEILLRAQTVYYINQQDWVHYVPVTTEYLAKYGEHVRAEEKKMFQDAIDQHKEK
jgi:hypothetical protein